MGRWLLLLLALAACGDKKKQKRVGDAAPVEIVTQAIDAADATATEEIEPNDGVDTATPITLGGSAHGKIEPDAVDYFALDVGETGALAVAIGAIDADLSLEVLDGAGTLIAKSDRVGKRVEEAIPNLGVTPGRYTVIVRGKKLPPAPKPKKPKKGAKAAEKTEEPPAAAIAYDVTVKLAQPAANAEHEPDDDRGTANPLIIGETVSGYVGWSGDADLYKVSTEALAAKNVLDLEVSAVDGTVLTVELADALGTPLVVRKGAKGAALTVPGLTPAIAAGAPPFVYVTVKGDRSNPATAYQLRAAEQPAPEDVDTEPNDTPEQAMPIPSERTAIVARWAVGDIDCFAVPPGETARLLEVSVDTQDDADLAIELLVEGKVVAKGDTPGKGGVEKVTGLVPAGVTAIARVRATETSAPATYNLKLAEGPAPP